MGIFWCKPKVNNADIIQTETDDCETEKLSNSAFCAEHRPTVDLHCPNCGSKENPQVDYARSVAGYGKWVVCPDCKYEELT